MTVFDYEGLTKRLTDDGGFSVSRAGRSAHSGIMVSRGGEQVVSGIASTHDVQAFAESHDADLNRRGYYMGGWVEHTDAGPQTVLDVSMRFPTNERVVGPNTADHVVRRRDRVASAQLQGAVHGQRALYDIDRGEELSIDPPLPWGSEMQKFDVTDFPRRPVRHPSEFTNQRDRMSHMEMAKLQQLHLPI